MCFAVGLGQFRESTWLNPGILEEGPADRGLTEGSKDAVARVTFTQGSLTIHATGKGQSGIAIIELFESPDP